MMPDCSIFRKVKMMPLSDHTSVNEQTDRFADILALSVVDLPGITNVRDLGGFPAGGGRRVASRRLFRGEILAQSGANPLYASWNEERAEPFRELGIKTVIDLRSEHESERTVSAWQDATGAEKLVALPIADGGEGTDTSFVRMVLSGALKRFSESHMTMFYCGMIEREAETFAAAVNLLADSNGLPALVHCTAGKDRTGLLIALVLDLLGTPRENIIDDYVFTGILRPNRVNAYAHMFHEAGVDPEAGRVLFETPAESMRHTLEFVDDQFGGTVEYFVSEGGLDATVIERLRDVMLVNP
jgi:protein-tyrosine phosphatase